VSPSRHLTYGNFFRLVKELVSLCSFPNCVAKIQPFFISPNTSKKKNSKKFLAFAQRVGFEPTNLLRLSVNYVGPPS